jgi:hypothetical protein
LLAVLRRLIYYSWVRVFIVEIMSDRPLVSFPSLHKTDLLGLLGLLGTALIVTVLSLLLHIHVMMVVLIHWRPKLLHILLVSLIILLSLSSWSCLSWKEKHFWLHSWRFSVR